MRAKLWAIPVIPSDDWNCKELCTFGQVDATIRAHRWSHELRTASESIVSFDTDFDIRRYVRWRVLCPSQRQNMSSPTFQKQTLGLLLIRSPFLPIRWILDSLSFPLVCLRVTIFTA